LSLEEAISNFNNFWYEYSWHNWPSNSIFNIPPHPMSVSALPGETRTNKIRIEMNGNMSKNIPNTIDCDLKKNCQILIIFGANIFDTTCIQMTILVPISSNVCFCTTWENPNR